MEWEIKPYVGLGPIMLGMTRSDVAAVLDTLSPVMALDKEQDGSEREHRSATVPIVSYMDARVSGIDTNRDVTNVVFEGIDLYREDPRTTLQWLEKKNEGALIAFDLIVFQKIGVSTRGFYFQKENKFFKPGGGDQDDRGLGIFVRGAFAAYDDMFHPITFAEP